MSYENMVATSWQTSRGSHSSIFFKHHYSEVTKSWKRESSKKEELWPRAATIIEGMETDYRTFFQICVCKNNDFKIWSN